MASTRIFPVDLCACFARLLDDEVREVLFHYRFDIGLLVPWNYNEALHVGGDPVILGRKKLDLLDTRFIAALAVERQRLVDAVLFAPSSIRSLMLRNTSSLYAARSAKFIGHCPAGQASGAGTLASGWRGRYWNC